MVLLGAGCFSFMVTEGSERDAAAFIIWPLLAGGLLVLLARSALPSLIWMSRAGLHAYLVLPVLGASLSGSALAIAVGGAPGGGVSLQTAVILVLVQPIFWLLGIALALPSRAEPRLWWLATFRSILSLSLVLLFLGANLFAIRHTTLLRETQGFVALNALCREHFRWLAPAIAGFGVLLYFRSHRAFRRLEWSPSPFLRS